MKPPTAIISEHVDLARLATTANTEHATAGQYLGKALEHARRAGVALQQAKDSLPHGRFCPWLELTCRFSDRTARNYMLIARNWQAIESSDAESVRDAVRLLTAKDSDPENGNALPFCLPPVGQMVLGVFPDGDDMTNWTYVVIESVGKHWIRGAIAGDTLTYDRRGWHRDYFSHWFNGLQIDAAVWTSIQWHAPRAVAPENNPLRMELPVWKYGTEVSDV